MTTTQKILQGLLLILMCALSAIFALAAFGSAQAPSSPQWSSAYAKAAPAVVTINTAFADQSTMQGSGWAIDDQHLVTNAHVITTVDTQTGLRIAGDSVTVTTHYGKTLAAQVVGFHAASDIAVLRVEHDLAPLKEADQAVVIGQDVAALGAPFAQSGSLTRGIVSMTGRQRSAIIADALIANLIQTDAPINPGNSGGPLINDQGQVLGMVTQIQTLDGDHDGIGYAIPTEQVQLVVRALLEPKTQVAA